MHTACSSSPQPGGSASVHAVINYTPLGVGLETPPWPDPSTSPLGVGREPSSVGQTPQLPHWVWAWRSPQARPLKHPLGVGLEGMLGYTPPGDLQGMLGYHLQGMLGYHPPPWTGRHV